MQPERPSASGIWCCLCSPNTRLMLFFAAAFLVPLSGTLAHAETNGARPPCPPPTRVDNVKDEYGATTVSDPYRWLEDQNSPETRAWIDAEQHCTEAALSVLPGRAAISSRLHVLKNVDTFQTPIERAGRYFFLKRPAGQDLSLLYMRRSSSGPDELLIDPLPWSPDHSVSLGLEEVSRDARLVFYSRREGGEDETTVHVREVATRRDLPDTLPLAVYFTVAPTPDDRGVYYTRTTSNGPRLFYHSMGTDAAQDRIVFGESLGKDKVLAFELSEDGQSLLITVSYGSGSERTDLYVQNLKDHGPVVAVVNDQAFLFYGHLAGDTLYIRTNSNAPRWHIVATTVSAPAQDHWKEVVPEAEATIEDFSPSGGKLTLLYTHNAASELKVFSPDGQQIAPLALPALGTASDLSSRWGGSELLFTFESFNSPPTIYRADISRLRPEVWASSKVPLDLDAFETRQVWITSKDKTRVPVFLFSKKGLSRDGARPVLLTGYGGFDLNETPKYFAEYILWAERGGIVARASLRGGGEFGEAWHRAGMLQNKQNVFDDFIAVGEFLVANQYTSPGRLAIRGGSNGGLLVGAAITQRPELFQAAVCLYPLLDMLRYQRFLDGPYWVPEYGSADVPAQFSWLYSYSPYHRTVDGTKYPAVLFVTGDGDTRVAPLHARKMAARLQAATGSGRPVLLLYDTKSGHSGGKPLNKEIDESTDVLSFLFWQLNVPIL